MKTWVFILVAAGLGLSVGWGTTIMESMSHEELFLPVEFAEKAQQAEEARRKRIESKPAWPKVEIVDGRVYEFGSMERYSKQNHTFLIKNVGDAPLNLKVKRTTCKCTISSVDGEAIMPGETGEIVVEWTGKTLTLEPEFRQGVEIITNDPEMELLSLVITGYVTETIRALPPEIALGGVSSNTGTEAEFRLYGFRSDEIKINGAEFEDASTADSFTVEFEPLPKEEVEKEKGAVCGLLGKISVKSGLPLGPINQTIRIQTHVDRDATIYMPMKGQVVSDIVIASSSLFNSRRNLVNFGPLKRNESAKIVLDIYVKGDHRNETTFSVGEIDPPEYLKVNVGPPKELNRGKTIRHQVTIEIPAGLPRLNRLGAAYAKHGTVVLETTHPTTKQVPIHVRFAVD